MIARAILPLLLGPAGCAGAAGMASINRQPGCGGRLSVPPGCTLYHQHTLIPTYQLIISLSPIQDPPSFWPQLSTGYHADYPSPALPTPAPPHIISHITPVPPGGRQPSSEHHPYSTVYMIPSRHIPLSPLTLIPTAISTLRCNFMLNIILHNLVKT